MNATLPLDALRVAGKSRVWRLKELYGLSGAPRFLQERFLEVMLGMVFSRLFSDCAVFVRDKLFVRVFVEELIVTGTSLSVAWFFAVSCKTFSC